MNITADIAVTEDLQKALQGAVFAWRSMQNGENDIRAKFRKLAGYVLVEFQVENVFIVRLQSFYNTLG